MIKKQYDQCTETYASEVQLSNAESKECFYAHLDIPLLNKNLLDIGCGDGIDFPFYHSKGANLFALDESENMLKLAKKKDYGAHIHRGDFKNLPYQDNYFDVVCSKWALQTEVDIQRVYEEVNRVLKSKGYFIFLVTHPHRQFMEQMQMRDSPVNYFAKSMVKSTFFDGKITAFEPSHTFNEYFSPYFLSKFELLAYEEQLDSASEVVEGHIYPSFFLVKGRKK